MNESHHYGANNDGDVRKRVAKVMNEDAAQVQVGTAANQRQCNSTVNEQGGNGSPDHPTFYHLNGRAQALNGLIAQPNRKKDQYNCICERR